MNGTRDYLVTRVQMSYPGMRPCDACRTEKATVSVMIQRVEHGKLWYDNGHDYCESCSAAAAERTHAECHRRLYGELPPPRKERGAA